MLLGRGLLVLRVELVLRATGFLVGLLLLLRLEGKLDQGLSREGFWVGCVSTRWLAMG